MLQARCVIPNQRGVGLLHLQWPDGSTQSLSHARLRAACPCSQCRAARLNGRIDLVNQGVRVAAVNTQGYGVQLVFSDGHQRGSIRGIICKDWDSGLCRSLAYANKLFV